MKAVLTAVAREAGAFMMKHFRRLEEGEIERKSSLKDLVTFVDRESENLIFDRLKAELPDHGLLGEESGQVREGSGGVFIIDPLDGTTNYAQGLPHFAVSIARRKDERTTHGLIYLPYFDEMFYAERGAGAYLNEKRLQVTTKTDLADCLVATGFACVRGGYRPDGLPIFNRLIYRLRDLRRLGAATVDLAYVASGIFDGFYEIGLEPWDVCAGALMVEEAGGTVSGFGGETDPLFGPRILATNGFIHDEIKSIIEEAIGEP